MDFQKEIGKILTRDFPFNAKSDNILDLSKIHNMVITALTDEEQVGVPRCVGTLILQNRMYDDVSQSDLERVSYLRKLLGSTLERISYLSTTL